MGSSSRKSVALVVEDEVIVRMFAIDVLKDAGYEVLAAGNADQAVFVLEARGDIDVIFTDINMPGSMDGLNLARAVRRRWPAIRILLTSGLTSPSSDDMPTGGKFISKPYRPDQIETALRELAA